MKTGTTAHPGPQTPATAAAAPAADTPAPAAPPAAALFTTLRTPDGPFSLLVAADAVLASGWTADQGVLLALVHPTLRPPAAVAAVPREEIDAGPQLDAALAAAATDAVAAVDAYYAGDLAAPGRIPVRQHSGAFRIRAWAALRGVEPGERLTYAAYAARAGHPTAVRAAAAACALNAAALFVPCHRILRTDGTLGGFRYGLELKQRLLDRETGGSASVLF